MERFEAELSTILGDFHSEYFESVILGGAWTLEFVGAAEGGVDATRGQAKKGLPHEWCRNYGFNPTKRFGHNRHGSECAGKLAKMWCSGTIVRSMLQILNERQRQTQAIVVGRVIQAVSMGGCRLFGASVHR